ncbi:hypothetical protein LZ554_001122 [Drepanopeziza brunnea f. sp. 'monogermtubi']|nr:hypothetical protein LZ554_001122 [Drepanopeziza brunnea f. sp. 'monogermtubi']
MLPHFFFGEYPALEFDYGEYSASELEALLGDLQLVQRRVQQARRATLALDTLRQRRCGEKLTRLNTKEQEFFYHLCTTSRYTAHPDINLAWLPVWAFIGLIEHLSGQYLTSLAMSRKVLREAINHVWPQIQAQSLVSDKYHVYLKRKDPAKANLFASEMDSPQMRISQAVPMIPRQPKRGSAGLFLGELPSLLNQSSPVRIFRRSMTENSRVLQRADEHPFSMLVLSLLHIWGGQDIPTLMLHRVAQPRRRWNSQGEIEEAALDQETVSQFSRVSVDVEWLRSQCLVQLGTRDGQETISLPPGVQEGLRGTITDTDRVRASTYLCQSFPGDKDLEPFSQTLRRLHLRAIQHVAEFVVDLVERRLLSSQQQLDFADVLLESSKLADPSSKGHDWRFKAVDIADKILASHPNHILHISAIIRRKASSRLINGKIYHEPVLSGIPLTAQSNALLWDLRLSKAQDYVENDDFTGAQQEISHFVSFDPSQASTLEKCVHKRIRFHLIRIRYLAGDFVDVESLLKQELQSFSLGAELYDSLIYFLVGVNCELRNPTEALRLAKGPPRDPKMQSRMNVLLAEAHLHVGMEGCLSNFQSPTSLTEARLICEKVMHSQESSSGFHQVTAKDRTAQVERVAYLRVVSVLARIYTLEAIFNGGDVNKAREKWIHFLEAVNRCGWSKRGYMEGICHYSIAALEMRSGQLDASQRDLQIAPLDFVKMLLDFVKMLLDSLSHFQAFLTTTEFYSKHYTR